VSITVIIPARNEQENISDSINSLLDQTVKPSKIIIVLDRCTDDSEKIVDDLIKNQYRKHGQLLHEQKLNQTF